MLFSDIRERSLSAASNNPEVLAQAIANAMTGRLSSDFGEVSASHSCPLQDAPTSCRLLMNNPVEGMVDFPGGSMTALAIAYDLTEKLVRQACYQQCPGNGKVKGWEVHRVTVRGRPAALVCAAWVHPHQE